MKPNQKINTLHDFLEFIRTDNIGAILSLSMDGFSFREVMEMVEIYHRNNRIHLSLSRQMARLFDKVSQENGYEVNLQDFDYNETPQ